jgi:abhydrolase domain-containing protein 6
MLFSEEHKKGGIMKRILRTLLIVTVLFSFGGCTSFQESLFEFSMSAERHRSHMIVKKADIGDQEISYLEREGKGETIVLLHGFGADKDNWIRFARQMPEDYRIVAIDLLGHGDNSRDFNKTYDLDYITDFTWRGTRWGDMCQKSMPYKTPRR